MAQKKNGKQISPTVFQADPDINQLYINRIDATVKSLYLPWTKSYFLVIMRIEMTTLKSYGKILSMFSIEVYKTLNE